MKTKITFLLTFFVIVLSFKGTAQCNGADFEEVNGIAIYEMESGSSPSSWNVQTNASGFSGSGFLTWTGAQFFGSPGVATISYRIRINNPGTYRFIWRSRSGLGDNFTEHNDTWLRIPDASDFFAQRGSSTLYPHGSGKTPNPNGAGAGGWFKVYVSSSAWSWQATTSDFDGHPIYARFNSAGVYTIQISARSSFHFIDRMVLYNESQYSIGQAADLSRSQTNCNGDNPPPPPDDPTPPGENAAPTVSITNPTNGQNFNSGSNVSIGLNTNDSDGSVVFHQIFVNGTLVDTDGSNYSPHIISNVTAGNYTVRALVRDNDGATAENTIQFSVGSDNPPPPPPPDDPTPPGDGENAAPTVSITNPTNGQNFNPGNTVSISLNANDSDGSVVFHQIFVNGVLVDTDGANFTPHIISNIAAGNYTVRALVRDNDGATAETSIQFPVGSDNPPPPDDPTPPGDGGNGVPTVSITSPSNGQNFNPGSTVTVSLATSDSDGSVVFHQIYVNGVLVDTDGANFTPHYITNAAAGNYTVRAFVRDNDGNSAETTTQFSVGGDNPPPPPPGDGGNNAPTVTITSPSNGQSFSPGSTVTVALNANDSDGSVVFHQIFVNGTLVDTDGANFTPHFINNVSAGNYTVRAFVRDNDGATAETTTQFSVGATPSSVENAIAFPNPVIESIVEVRMTETVNSTVAYSVTNVSGVEISRGTIPKTEIENDGRNLKIALPVQTEPGVYYVVLQTLDGQKTIPIIKK